MSVIGEVGTPIQDVIIDSLSDFAIRTGGLLASYVRFKGGVC